jgi:adenine C2-methylase RlmN of 23S rRNA A2503 and tRNA A37
VRSNKLKKYQTLGEVLGKASDEVKLGFKSAIPGSMSNEELRKEFVKIQKKYPKKTIKTAAKKATKKTKNQRGGSVTNAKVYRNNTRGKARKNR